MDEMGFAVGDVGKRMSSGIQNAWMDGSAGTSCNSHGSASLQLEKWAP